MIIVPFVLKLSSMKLSLWNNLSGEANAINICILVLLFLKLTHQRPLWNFKMFYNVSRISSNPSRNNLEVFQNYWKNLILRFLIIIKFNQCVASPVSINCVLLLKKIKCWLINVNFVKQKFLKILIFKILLWIHLRIFSRSSVKLHSV